MKNKFNKLVEEIITWEKMAGKISIVSLKEKNLLQYWCLQTDSLIVVRIIIES